MKEQILRLLKQSNGQYISGQALSEMLSVSRTAIWKHINQLKDEGYIIESVTKSGYRLLSSPDLINPDELLSELKGKRIGKEIRRHDSVPSTQKIAHEWAKEGAVEGSIVVAEQQTEGRGRLGRSWHSPFGTGIWCSLILRPNIALPEAPQLTLLAAVAITRAIKKLLDVDISIKWPNDLLSDGKKFCGILTELNAEADQIHYIVIGFGINVNVEIENFPEQLRDIATSLTIQTGEHISRVRLLAEILNEFELLYDLYLKDGFRPIKLLWETYALSIGQKITARTLQGDIVGVAKGIDDFGVLILEAEDGSIKKVYSADIKRHED